MRHCIHCAAVRAGSPFYDHFLALCFAQFTYRQSLRDIEACLNARPGLAYRLGFRGHVTRTNLAYANQRRDWRLFATVARHLMDRARRFYVDSPGDFDPPQAAFALDASLIHLSARLFPWAVIGRRTSTAIKLHMLLSLRGNIPAWAALTPGGFSEVRMLDELPVQPGCFYVMDRGYLDFSRLRGVAVQDGFFIVRGRRKLGCVIRQSHPVDPASFLRGDDKIQLTNPHSRRSYRGSSLFSVESRLWQTELAGHEVEHGDEVGFRSVAASLAFGRTKDAV